MSTMYRACGTPSAGTSSTVAGRASATPLTVPRSRATPVWASPGLSPATRTETGNGQPGALAKGTARVTVTLPSAIRCNRSAAARAGVKGVPEETAAELRGTPVAASTGTPDATLSRAVVATTALPRNGTGATALPSASAAVHTSRYEAPAPPSRSGMSSPAQPRSPATVCHSPSS
jgi:hypothetical protein